MSTHAIDVQHLNYAYRIREGKTLLRRLFAPELKIVHAVKDLSLTIKPGEAVALLGPNGAGKTTTTKVLAGILTPTEGDVRVLGAIPSERDPAHLRRIGFVMGGKPGLTWELAARQSFELLQQMYHIPKALAEERVRSTAALLGVTDLLDRKIRFLSLGQRMKMELIGSILHRPEVLFLDEPTIGLDILAKRSLRAFLRTIHREDHTTIILTSHDMADVEEVCDRVVVINHGSTIHDGSLSELLKQYRRTRYIRVLRAPDAPELTIPQHAAIVPHSDGEGVVVRVPEAQFVSALGTLAQQEGTLDVHIEQVPLESIIADMFERR